MPGLFVALVVLHGLLGPRGGRGEARAAQGSSGSGAGTRGDARPSGGSNVVAGVAKGLAAGAVAGALLGFAPHPTDTAVPQRVLDAGLAGALVLAALGKTE
mmetsp:Transcript_19323/g.60074  ORF Transcript_19323/g.60074 Transcript_19323/m.60074 type:complete len:101 (-) Transcript_19323:18-320(-)